MGAFRKRYVVLIQDSGKVVDWGNHEKINQGCELFVKPNCLPEMLHKFIRYFDSPRFMDPFSEVYVDVVCVLLNCNQLVVNGYLDVVK